ncbi:RNA polymerase sigma factor [[Clostridium] aminophilum]|uniref:RNA polymerase sigma-70 factor, ECF subfamily n=1 Tax=[Clostridium] aminophilum TaxID=1526 RepID=A0A1I6IHW0_9FIRM|nr:sigma-70 family RNA polymerase sigma factor [[Clostridium] aminophilum]SFR66251.1 RNA polymerase sigma-70 factor, ECF subfamily [[Clostridium] aminophilum]
MDEMKMTASDRAERYMDRYGNSILRMAYSYLHNMADAEDILQETLIRVIDADPEFEGENHEKAYLLRTAANLAKNRIEYNKRRESDELNEELAAESREDLTFLWEAVKKLQTKSAEVLHLFYQEGYQTAEIAQILGRKESTVRSDLRRARERLKTVLKEEYDFGEI